MAPWNAVARAGVFYLRFYPAGKGTRRDSRSGAAGRFDVRGRRVLSSISMQTNYRAVLRQEFGRRCELWSTYKLSAFARDIGLSSARMSEVLAGKQGLSRAVAEKVAQKLGFDENRRSYFCDLVEMEDARSREQREVARRRVAARLANEFETVPSEKFQGYPEWYQLALLVFVECRGFREDYVWLGERLGVPPGLARAAVERLVTNGLLRRNGNGALVSTHERMVLSKGGAAAQAARAKAHGEILKRVQWAIETQGADRRDFSANFLAIRHEDVPAALKMIESFGRKFSEKFSRPEDSASVYCLSLQLTQLATTDDK